MSAILKFDFQKRKQLRFSEVNDLNYTKKKKPIFACDNYIFPKTRGNKNKQCIHSTPLKHISLWYVYFMTIFTFLALNLRKFPLSISGQKKKEKEKKKILA